MRVLVLGGNGFIGSHLVDSLLIAGHQVRVFDRSPEKYRKPLKGVDYRLASFDDIACLAEALDGIDIVYHLISTTVPSTSNKNPIFDVESNLINTIRLLDLMKDMNVKKIIYLSSGGTVYGIPEQVPIPETHSLNPICSYGIVKVAIENYIKMYHHLYGLNYSILRVSNPYGERQGHTGVQGVIATFMGKVHRDETIEIWGDGSIVRDFIYVGDLIELCLKVSKSDSIGVFNAGIGKGLSINNIVKLLSESSGKDIEVSYASNRNYDVPQVVLNINKTKDVFDWSPKIGFHDGFKITWNWMVGVNS